MKKSDSSFYVTVAGAERLVCFHTMTISSAWRGNKIRNSFFIDECGVLWLKGYIAVDSEYQVAYQNYVSKVLERELGL